MQDMTVTAVILAAGSSRRMGFDKLKYAIQGRTVLERSILAFESNDLVDEIVLVRSAQEDWIDTFVSSLKKKTVILPGGAERFESAIKGVMAASGKIVAIHDAARPFVSQDIITETIKAAFHYGAAAPAVPVKDTIKIAENSIVLDTPERKNLFAMQTPQCFLRAKYLEFIKKENIFPVTDDCQIFEKNGHAVYLTEGSYDNYKITTTSDIKESKKMRIGHGYDVHRLCENRDLILGGIRIPYEKGLLGHSDADVLVHAIIDSLLGAAALGDIGKLFPDNDPLYEGIDSCILLERTDALLKEHKWRIENIDATILCQRPKLSPHIMAMREKLSSVLGLDLDRVSIKATTEEGLGFTGKCEGIAAHAVALITESSL